MPPVVVLRFRADHPRPARGQPARGLTAQRHLPRAHAHPRPLRWILPLPTDRFEDALQKITYDFAMQIVELIRTTTVEELTTLAQPPAPEVAEPEAQVTEPQPPTPKKPARRRGRPPKAKTEASPAKAGVAKTTKAPDAKPTKKRNWPTCSVKGCDKSFYGPSGAARRCYGHHLDAGGKQSPLVAGKAKRSSKA